MKFPTEEFTLSTVCCVSLSSASYCDLQPFIYACTLQPIFCMFSIFMSVPARKSQGIYLSEYSLELLKPVIYTVDEPAFCLPQLLSRYLNALQGEEQQTEAEFPVMPFKPAVRSVQNKL